MVAVEEADPSPSILAQDPGHQVWIDGISQSCGRDEPSVATPNGVRLDQYTRTWSWVWLVTDGDRNVHNYGVRITQQGRKYGVLVRGPQGHVSIDHWFWFPGPDHIITMAMMAGFDW